LCFTFTFFLSAGVYLKPTYVIIKREDGGREKKSQFQGVKKLGILFFLAYLSMDGRKVTIFKNIVATTKETCLPFVRKTPSFQLQKIR